MAQVLPVLVVLRELLVRRVEVAAGGQADKLAKTAHFTPCIHQGCHTECLAAAAAVVTAIVRVVLDMADRALRDVYALLLALTNTQQMRHKIQINKLLQQPALALGLFLLA